MSDCRKCADFEWCMEYEECGLFKPKIMTKADRIRAMTDEELAKFIISPTPQGICTDRCGGDIDYSCSECALEWLKQEVNDGRN